MFVYESTIWKVQFLLFKFELPSYHSLKILELPMLSWKFFLRISIKIIFQSTTIFLDFHSLKIQTTPLTYRWGSMAKNTGVCCDKVVYELTLDCLLSLMATVEDLKRYEKLNSVFHRSKTLSFQLSTLQAMAHITRSRLSIITSRRNRKLMMMASSDGTSWTWMRSKITRFGNFVVDCLSP